MLAMGATINYLDASSEQLGIMLTVLRRWLFAIMQNANTEYIIIKYVCLTILRAIPSRSESLANSESYF